MPLLINLMTYIKVVSFVIGRLEERQETGMDSVGFRRLCQAKVQGNHYLVCVPEASGQLHYDRNL